MVKTKNFEAKFQYLEKLQGETSKGFLAHHHHYHHHRILNGVNINLLKGFNKIYKFMLFVIESFPSFVQLQKRTT